jgi:hypothetical protein
VSKEAGAEDFSGGQNHQKSLTLLMCDPFDVIESAFTSPLPRKLRNPPALLQPFCRHHAGIGIITLQVSSTSNLVAR